MKTTAQQLIRPIRKFDGLTEFFQISSPIIGYASQYLGWTVTAYCDVRGFFCLSRSYGTHTIETLQICFSKKDGKFGKMESCDRIMINVEDFGNPITNLRIASAESIWHNLHLPQTGEYPTEPAEWFTNLIGGE